MSGGAMFTPAQNAFGFFEDGAESSSSAIAATNANITRNVATLPNLQLRVRIQETGGAAGATTDDYQLQYSKNGGAFTSITGSSSNVRGFNSASLTDAGTTTNRLGSGTGSFVAGEISEVGLVTDRQLTASNYTEMLYSLSLVAADLANGDTLDFRVLANGSTMTYNVTPRITVQEPTTQTATGSLDAAVQRQALTLNASLNGAVQVARSASASLDSAVRRALTATATLQAAVRAAQSSSASQDAAVRSSRSGTASIDGRVVVPGSAAASMDSAVRAGQGTTAGMDSAVRAGRTGASGMDGAIRTALDVQAGLDAALRASLAVTASFDARVTTPAPGSSAEALLDAAIRAARSASAALDVAIATMRSASASLDGALRAARAAGAGMDAQVLVDGEPEPPVLVPRVLGTAIVRRKKRRRGEEEESDELAEIIAADEADLLILLVD